MTLSEFTEKILLTQPMRPSLTGWADSLAKTCHLKYEFTLAFLMAVTDLGSAFATI